MHIFTKTQPQATSTEEELTVEETEAEEAQLTVMEAPAPVWGPKTFAYYGPEQRAVLITDEITFVNTNTIISQILSLTSTSSDPIRVYINTPGGSVVQGLAIYDILRIVDAPIITIALGECSSMGLYLLQAGDIRLATPHTRFFHHEPITYSYVCNKETHEAAAETREWVEQRTQDILRQRAKINKRTWKKFFADRIHFNFDIKTALELKIIDDILEYASKPKIELGGTSGE
jgi:ATP-dependent Clp protease, protease subunit